MPGRRGNKEGTIRKRDDGRWEAMYSDAAHKRRSIYGKTRQEVASKLAAAIRDRDKGLLTADTHTTLEAYVKQWLETKRPPVIRESSWIRLETHFRVHILPAIGKVKLAQLTRMHLQQLYAAKLADGLGQTTVNHMHGAIHQALRDAMLDDLILRNVADLVKPPRIKKREMQIYTPQQVDTLLASVEGHRLAALIVLTVATGMRAGELLALKWSHVDLASGLVHVRRTRSRVAGGKYVDEPPKTESGSREIKLVPLAVEALKAHKRRIAEERLALGEAWKDEDRVFPSTVGTAIDPPNWDKQWDRMVQRAGLPPIHFHDLRHSAASWLIGHGVPITDVAKLLGHADVTTTLRIYAHAMPGSHELIAKAMEALLPQPPSEKIRDAFER